MHHLLGVWMNLLRLLSVRRMVSWCDRFFTRWNHQKFITKRESLGKHWLSMKKNLEMTRRYKGGGKLYMKWPVYLVHTTTIGIYLVNTLVFLRVLMVLTFARKPSDLSHMFSNLKGLLPFSKDPYSSRTGKWSEHNLGRRLWANKVKWSSIVEVKRKRSNLEQDWLLDHVYLPPTSGMSIRLVEVIKLEEFFMAVIRFTALDLLDGKHTIFNNRERKKMLSLAVEHKVRPF